MDARSGPEATTTQERTTVERTSERELVVTRTIDGPPHIVFDAWTQPELLRRWWVPKSVPITLLSCEMDVRVGGTYRLVFQVDPTTTMAFFGRRRSFNSPRQRVWDRPAGSSASYRRSTSADHSPRACSTSPPQPEP